MANVCRYKVIVKGKKNACYAFYGSMFCFDQTILKEKEDNGIWTMSFDGSCGWAVDAYCEPWKGDFPVALPEDSDKAMSEAGDKYLHKTVQERSKMFEVEVWCNSADIDVYDPHYGPREIFEHYINGKKAGGHCPEELRIGGYLLDDSDTSCASDFVIYDGFLVEYTGPGGDVSIPDGVTVIADCAFIYCGSLTSITIPNGVTTIGKTAFANCTRLTSITIPDSVTAIYRDAFSNCRSLTSITIPDSVTTIEKGTFWGCKSLTSITIPDSVTTIESDAFWGCDLTSVTIPDSVTTIGDRAFAFCEKLASVTIPDSVTTIGDGAFAFCEKLTSVTIPDSVTTIGDDVFKGCDKLK